MAGERRGDAAPARTPPPDAVRAEALRLCERATERSLTLRIIGSIAVQLYCPAQADLLVRLGRRPVRDVDLVGYAREQRHLETMFEEEGWVLDPVIRQAKEYGVSRLIYTHPGSHHKVDVFLDRLVMSHTLDLRDRLAGTAPNVPLGDLLLSKLQIHEITTNDLLDLTILLAAHDPMADQVAVIDLPYVLGVLGNDWGFCRSALLNLEKLSDALRGVDLAPETVVLVQARVGALRDAIEGAPKSRRWRLRATIGTRAPWYQDVDEVERGE